MINTVVVYGLASGNTEVIAKELRPPIRLLIAW